MLRWFDKLPVKMADCQNHARRLRQTYNYIVYSSAFPP